MSFLTITKYPEKVLRRKAEQLKEITPEIQKLIDDMIETMYKANGVGLAAPQVGIPLRLIIVDTPKGPLAVVNPKIIKKTGRQKEQEGCLSLPGLFFPVKRAAKVTVRGLFRNGKEFELEAEGLVARIFQHEINHIDGKLIVHTLNVFKRLMILRKWRKPWRAW